MSLFTILKFILILIVIISFQYLYIHYFVRLLKYFIDKDYMFLARLSAVVLTTIFCVVNSFSSDMFIDYMSRVLP